MCLSLKKVRGWLFVLLFFSFCSSICFAEDSLPYYRPASENRISSDWLLYRPQSAQFNLYIPEIYGQAAALYQWVDIRRDRPFRISFTAKKDLCLFINNQLLFTADSVATYELNLSKYIKSDKPTDRYLLCVWHPLEQPDVATFKNAQDTELMASATSRKRSLIRNKVHNVPNYNTFIISLLFLGVLYGILRTSYTSDFYSLFRIGSFTRRSALDEGFLAKPISSWSSILFLIAFSLSFALLIVAIHTNIQNVVIFNRLFAVSEKAIITRILFYTFLILSFLLLKFLFLTLMGYVFDLTALVSLQYREFIRTTLFLGISLPMVMMLYLALNSIMPNTVLLISNVVVTCILIITVIRIIYTLNKKVTLRNLHLFSYICATEIIPLIILLKLIVFNY